MNKLGLLLAGTAVVLAGAGAAILKKERIDILEMDELDEADTVEVTDDVRN